MNGGQVLTGPQFGGPNSNGWMNGYVSRGSVEVVAAVVVSSRRDEISDKLAHTYR